MRTDNDSTLIMRRRLEELAVFEYRSVVVARLGVTAEWRGLDWTNRAACAGHPAATARLCGRCPVAARVPRCRGDHRRPVVVARVSQPSRPRTPVGRPGTHLPRPPRPRADADGHRTTPAPPRPAPRCRPRERTTLMITADRSDTDLYTETVAALTRAARQRHADGSPYDFSDFLAHALAATAANVGGPDQLVAGRPGSWESGYVDGLVRGTIGDQPEDWTWYRTQPIVVRLNVAELIEDGLHHPGLMGLDEALENIGGRHESAGREQDLDAWDPRSRQSLTGTPPSTATTPNDSPASLAPRRTDPRVDRGRVRRGRHRSEQHLVVDRRHQQLEPSRERPTRGQDLAGAHRPHTAAEC